MACTLRAEELEELSFQEVEELAFPLKEHWYVVVESLVLDDLHASHAPQLGSLHHVLQIARAHVHAHRTPPTATTVPMCECTTMPRSTTTSMVMRMQGKAYGCGAFGHCAGVYVGAMGTTKVEAGAKGEGACGEVGVEKHGRCAHRGSDHQHAGVCLCILIDEGRVVLYTGPRASRVLEIVAVGGVSEVEDVEGHAGRAGRGRWHRPLLHPRPLCGKRDEEERCAMSEAGRFKEMIDGGEAISEKPSQPGWWLAYVPSKAKAHARQLACVCEVEAVGAQSEIEERKMIEDSSVEGGEIAHQVGLDVQTLELRE
mmetsp:Transcript_73046/g.145284  ORF Transcript_73046/g.145284 Transcript_73046/m.145284 type:complete len:313 (+) Transcript_73046:224-1162(+)